jgi:hypothetical protein
VAEVRRGAPTGYSSTSNPGAPEEVIVESESSNQSNDLEVVI